MIFIYIISLLINNNIRIVKIDMIYVLMLHLNIIVHSIHALLSNSHKCPERGELRAFTPL